MKGLNSQLGALITFKIRPKAKPTANMTIKMIANCRAISFITELSIVEKSIESSFLNYGIKRKLSLSKGL